MSDPYNIIGEGVGAPQLYEWETVEPFKGVDIMAYPKVSATTPYPSKVDQDVITKEDLIKQLELMKNQPYKPPEYVLHPDHYEAWIAEYADKEINPDKIGQQMAEDLDKMIMDTITNDQEDEDGN